MRRAFVLAPAALVLLAAGVFLGRFGNAPVPGPGAARRAMPPRQAPDVAPAAAGGVRESVAKLFAVEKEPAPARTLVDRLRRNFSALNDEEILHARAALARLLEDRPETAAELASLFEQEADEDVLLVLAQVLGGNAAAMADPAVIGAMVRVAESGTIPAGRGGALLVLMNLPRPDDRVSEAVIRLARSEAEHRDLRASAIAAAAAWMQNHPAGSVPLAQALIDVARSAADGDVRGHALQAVALVELPADASRIEAMAPFLRDPEAKNRSLAALALGGAAPEAREGAVRHLEGAIGSERSEEAQRGILIHLVRAAGPGAEAALARLRDQAPRLAADVRDYLEILALERDPAKVWELKLQRDLSRGVVPGADTHTD